MKTLPVLKALKQTDQGGGSNKEWISECAKEAAALKRLAEEIVYLVEESTSLQAGECAPQSIGRPSRVSVLCRRDRTVAFLAGYSSRASDCPFYLDDSTSSCLTLINRTTNLPEWDCLGLAFHQGIPCSRLWKIIALEKNHHPCKLFDLPK